MGRWKLLWPPYRFLFIDLNKKNEILNSSTHHLLLLSEFAPRFTNHFTEFSLSMRVEQFELGVLLCKEEVVSTPIGLWMIGIAISLPSPPSSLGLRSNIRNNGIVWSCQRGGSIFKNMVEHSLECLKTHGYRYKVSVVKFAINDSHHR